MTYNKNSITFQPIPTGHRGRVIQDLTDCVFARLTVLGYAGRNKRHYWWCECECGKIIKVQRGHLNVNGYQSCGCLTRERVIERCTTHGESAGVGTPEYRAYCSAKRRCNNPNVKEYKHYGGRGIEFRFDSFEQFLAEVGRRPTPTHSLDRIDVNGHYENGNLRWTTVITQQRNTRANRLVTALGETKCIAEWAETTQASEDAISTRLKVGWCDECAVTQPSGGTCSHRPRNTYFRMGWFAKKPRKSCAL